MMTKERAKQLIHTLIEPAAKEAAPMIRAAMEHNDDAIRNLTPSQVAWQIAETLVPRVIKMNSGDTAELLSLMVADNVVHQAASKYGAVKAMQDIVDLMRRELNNGEDGEDKKDE